MNILEKCKRIGAKTPLGKNILTMYYAMQDPAVPLVVKVAIVGAIAYFISPYDTFPDFLIAIGYTDDAMVVSTILLAIYSSINENHIRKAEEFLT
ncbi:YkvA family protein [Pseudanabaena sp. PCC 6802]|uniref:YkvA family protein n=1 Tax=Pseudanabaena sp. PCC 6802 TaxID=118173 RepID=UPI00037CC69A|nr:YkvA family protein [Pseudanabaena sp. PCC 6802]